MTTEEKYNKALELARTYYNGGNEFLDTIFPELKESEDERIRKSLVDWLKSLLEDYYEDGDVAALEMANHVECWIAYLEKQKEQKPVENSGKELLYVSNKSYNIGYRDGKMAAEQKTAEWSEEDEKVWQDIFDLCNRFGYDDACRKLKSLRPQPAWKPSEQEKAALRTAIRVLTKERNFPKTAGHLQAILDAFEGKESRKGWKPSDEQMRYLLAVINDPNNIGAESCYMTIKSLYNDLNKL